MRQAKKSVKPVAAICIAPLILQTNPEFPGEQLTSPIFIKIPMARRLIPMREP
jgi:hypothetical protein